MMMMMIVNDDDGLMMCDEHAGDVSDVIVRRYPNIRSAHGVAIRGEPVGGAQASVQVRCIDDSG
jgi:hypothetical protein